MRNGAISSEEGEQERKDLLWGEACTVLQQEVHKKREHSLMKRDQWPMCKM